MSAKRVKELAELMTVTELIDFRGRLESRRLRMRRSTKPKGRALSRGITRCKGQM